MSGPHSVRTIAAISSGSPRRPTGGSERRCCGRSGAPGRPRTVSIVPGTTQLTVMRCGARSSASARVRPASPALAVMTWARPSAPRCAVKPPMLTMVPPPARIRCGRQAWAQRNAPSSTVESTRRHSSKRISANGVSTRTAALFTRKSSRPNSRTAASTIAATAGASVTSAMCSTALPPADLIAASVCSASAREVLALIMTAAPPAASDRAIARPMFRALPVTRATLPASSSPGVIPALRGTRKSPFVLGYHALYRPKKSARRRPWRLGTRRGGLLYELMLHRVMHQLRIGGQTQFLEDAYPIGADRARAQEHLLRNLVDRLARSEQPHHPILAVGKRLVRRLLGVGRQLHRQPLGQRGADILAAAHHLADGGSQLLPGALLVHVAGTARLQHPPRVQLLRMHAQDQHRALRELAFDLAQQLQPAAARHRVIQDRHVPFELARELHGFIAVLRLAHHQHVGLAGQHLRQAVSHHRVIVRNQDLHRETSHSTSSAAEATPSPACPRHDFH